MIKKYRLRLQQYNDSPIDIYIGPSAHDIVKSDKGFLDHEGLYHRSKNSNGMTVIVKGNNKSALIVLLGTDVKDFNRVMVHELTHVAIICAEFFDYDITSNNSEPTAYLMDFLYTKGIEFKQKYDKALSKNQQQKEDAEK